MVFLLVSRVPNKYPNLVTKSGFFQLELMLSAGLTSLSSTLTSSNQLVTNKRNMIIILSYHIIAFLFVLCNVTLS